MITEVVDNKQNNNWGKKQKQNNDNVSQSRINFVTLSSTVCIVWQIRSEIFTLFFNKNDQNDQDISNYTGNTYINTR